MRKTSLTKCSKSWTLSFSRHLPQLNPHSTNIKSPSHLMISSINSTRLNNKTLMPNIQTQVTSTLSKIRSLSLSLLSSPISLPLRMHYLSIIPSLRRLKERKEKIKIRLIFTLFIQSKITMIQASSQAPWLTNSWKKTTNSLATSPKTIITMIPSCPVTTVRKMRVKMTIVQSRTVITPVPPAPVPDSPSPNHAHPQAIMSLPPHPHL